MIRYYGIYAHGIEDKLKFIDRKTWAKAIENSFNKDPEKCPECSTFVFRDIVFAFLADKEINKLVKMFPA